jgi:hypothetical protein
MKTLLTTIIILSASLAYSQDNDSMYPTEQELKKQVIESDPLPRSTFHTFVDRRAGGKVLQIIGALGISYTLFHQMKQAEKFNEAFEKGETYEMKEISSIIPALSGGIFAIGVIMDISAGLDLKK